MVVVLSKTCSSRDRERIRSFLSERGFSVREQVFGDDDIIGATGKGQVDLRELSLLPGVERVAQTSKPYELASRETHPEDTIVTVGPVTIGGSRITVIAGPCAVESLSLIHI
ncbi:MAG: hypothetical protein N2509_06775 [Treponemataceae bacterium]|nr:hypothetical protein [Treponemataceae bacterium]